MIRRTSLLAALAAVATLGCGPATPATDTAADEAAIAEVREREMSAFTGGDMEASMSVITDDAVIMPPGEPALNGAEAARAWLQALHDFGTLTGRYTDASITVLGDHAIEHFVGELTITPKAGGPAITETVKGIHVYERQADGTWRISHDVWNTDAPPSPPPASGDPM